MVKRSILQKKWITIPWVQLLLFCVLSVVIFSPNLGRSFVSDDFLVMKRVGMDGVVWIKDFFRPLSDITLYFNYLLDGFHPAGYYALNMLLHGINSWLLYRWGILWKWTEDKDRQQRYALIAALLFLAYPFHSEGVVWTLGRSTVASATFGMAGLVMAVSGYPAGKRIGWACLFYFIGMAGYESVLLLPLMVLVMLYRKVSSRELVWWMVALGVTLGIHLVVRILVSGGIAGGYGRTFLGAQLFRYGKNTVAMAARLFLPPMASSWGLMGLLLLLVMGFVAILLYLKRRLEWNWLLRLGFLIAITCAIPVVGGLSTHTSEGDRFLYFPSYFVCAGVAFFLVHLLPGRKWLAGVVSILLLYEVYFLEVNNWHWVEASATTRQVLVAVTDAMARKAGKRVFVVNLPDEKEGAFIFRLGLPEALLMERMDTAGLVIVSHLVRDVELTLPDSLSIRESGSLVRLPPDVFIRRMGADSFEIKALQGKMNETGGEWEGGRGDIVLFWDRRRFVQWDAGQ